MKYMLLLLLFVLINVSAIAQKNTIINNTKINSAKKVNIRNNGEVNIKNADTVIIQITTSPSLANPKLYLKSHIVIRDSTGIYIDTIRLSSSKIMTFTDLFLALKSDKPLESVIGGCIGATFASNGNGVISEDKMLWNYRCGSCTTYEGVIIVVKRKYHVNMMIYQADDTLTK